LGSFFDTGSVGSLFSFRAAVNLCVAAEGRLGFPLLFAAASAFAATTAAASAAAAASFSAWY
jgi:hypothetical protein